MCEGQVQYHIGFKFPKSQCKKIGVIMLKNQFNHFKNEKNKTN